MLNAMLQQRIIFAGDLHGIFNRSLNVERDVAAKNRSLLEICIYCSMDHWMLQQRTIICWRFACHIQQIIEY